MNLDRTFCTGLRCNKANTCDRWEMNLLRLAEMKGIDLSERRISIAQFADHEGRCTMYAPIEEPAGADSRGEN